MIASSDNPNAIMTLKEYLEDYASEETKKVGEKLIREELEKLSTVRPQVEENLVKIEHGERNFKF